MELELSINGVIKSLDVAPNESLLAMLRREGYTGVKHGCETGECGACTVLVDGLPRPACVMLVAQTGGCALTTVEGLGNTHNLHVLQEAFIDSGAIQCGFCTPGMLLSASALLKNNSSPSEEEVRAALSGNLCRCTGYVKPVQAVLRAAAIQRGEVVAPLSRSASDTTTQSQNSGRESLEVTGATRQKARTVTLSPTRSAVAGKSERKIDALKLVTGKPAFVDDIELRGMLYARILTSPHAHAMLRAIETSEASALPGVHAVLTYKDVVRVPYTSAGQDWSEPGPHDRYVLDNHMRFIGDRVAVVAAETLEIAEQALKLIEVDYEVLPAVLDPRLASTSQAPKLHPEEESYNIHDAVHNVAALVQAEVGNVERGFAQADLVVEGEYVVPQVQQVPLENHIAITYWDEDERLVVRSSTQVPHQVRRIIAPLIGLPPRRIRVVRPEVGGSFGAKQDVLIEDLCALLTIATNRPVRLEYSRADEFRSGGSRHAQIIRMKTGVRRDGMIVANAMQLLANTGAYGAHALAVQSNAGAGILPLYPCANMRFEAQVLYTNLPPAGAFQGSGAPQGFFALESHIDEIARQLGIDALELRRKNWIKAGDRLLLAREPGHDEVVQSCGLAECLRIVEERLHWKETRGKGNPGRLRRGVGVALVMQSTTASGGEMGGASLKLNEDGSFHLLVGSGPNTEIAQIVAEVLGVRVEDIIMSAVDTDVTPFTSSADAFTNAGAARQVAEDVHAQMLVVAGHLLKVHIDNLTVKDRVITALNGQSVSVVEVALQSLYGEERQQIMATASWIGHQALPFAAQGAEVEIDTETGLVRVVKAVSAIDAGRAINPLLAEGRIEGAIALALGYGISEELLYDQRGNLLTTNLSDYRIFNALDMPTLETYLVETDAPTSSLEVREVAEISVAGMAAAVANALTDALGVRLRQIPLTPERVLRVLRAQAQARSAK